MFDRWLLLEDGRPNQVIDRGHVLYLLRKCSHSFEFAICRCKGIFILRHGVGSRNEFPLDTTYAAIQYLSDSAMFGRLSVLRQSDTTGSK